MLDGSQHAESKVNNGRKKMSEVITFNTKDLVAGNLREEKPVKKVFDLVAETHPILKQFTPEFDFNNPPVNPNEFASTLVDTAIQHHAIGLSAPQCGFLYRVFVMGAGDNYVAFFNPIVTKFSEEQVHLAEACVSFPLLGLHITRPSWVEVEYQDYTGETKTARFEGLSARYFQHELDHMMGVCYTERCKPLALQMAQKTRYKQLKKLFKFKPITRK
jgi:peptide deformylase